MRLFTGNPLPRHIAFFAICIIAAGMIMCAPGSAEEPGITRVPGKKLILGIPLYSEDALPDEDFISFINNCLDGEDIIFVRAKPMLIPLIGLIKKAKLAVIRQSLKDLEKDIETLASKKIKIDYICYNPEGFRTSHTPEEELKDLERAAQLAKSVAARHNAKLIIVPDHTVFKDNPRIAAYSDIFAYQFQRWQRLPDAEFRKNVEEIVGAVKRINPHTKIIAQFSTNPPTGRHKEDGKKEYVAATVQDMIAKVEAIRDLVDGVGFLVFNEDNGFERFKEFLTKMRHRENP